MIKTEYKVYCGICKKEMNHIGHNLLLTSYDLDKCDFKNRDLFKIHNKAIDICSDCLNKMKDISLKINEPDKETMVVKPIEILIKK